MYICCFYVQKNIQKDVYLIDNNGFFLVRVLGQFGETGDLEENFDFLYLIKFVLFVFL